MRLIMGKYGSCSLKELQPILMMVLSQIATGGSSILYKFALADGMKIKVLVFYRLMFATAFMTPLALIIERNSRPKLTWMIALQGFISGLLGLAVTNNLYGESLRLTSASYATAMFNLIPAVTMVMAIIFRLEILDIRTSAGKAKILGTLLGTSGAMVLTLFKGKQITIWSGHTHLLPSKGVAVPQNHVLGSLLALCGCLSNASWLIFQAKMSHRFPCYSSTALMCFMGSIQVAVYALCIEGVQWSTWKLGWNIRLLTSAYSGIVNSGIAIAVIIWCTMIRGPVFVSSFAPLGLVFISVVVSLCLDEKQNLGSIIGSILVIMGLYLVLLGKSKETKVFEAASSESRRDLQSASFSDSNQVANRALPTQHSDCQVNGQSPPTEACIEVLHGR